MSVFDSPTYSRWSGFRKLQYFCAGHDIVAPEQKNAHLFALPVEQKYETVSALVHGKTPATVSCNELVAALTTHFDSRLSKVYNRTWFQRRDQFPGDS